MDSRLETPTDSRLKTPEAGTGLQGWGEGGSVKRRVPNRPVDRVGVPSRCTGPVPTGTPPSVKLLTLTIVDGKLFVLYVHLGDGRKPSFHPYLRK